MAIASRDKRGILSEFMILQDSKCYYCKKVCFNGTIEQRINKDQYHDIATIEHLLPQGMPERDHKKNLVMACNQCNQERGRLLKKHITWTSPK